LLLPAIAAGIRTDLKCVQNKYKHDRTLYHKCRNTIKSDRFDSHSSLKASLISKSDTDIKDKKLEGREVEEKTPGQELFVRVEST